MRILVIGGTNFIGPPLVRRLVDLGHEVAVFHRGQTQADLPTGVEHVVGDRHDLRMDADEFRRFGPEVVVDMIAFTEADALGLVETFRGLARRSVVVSSADVYRAYGRFIGTEEGPVEPTPLTEESPLRETLFPYRSQAQGPGDFFFTYDKIPVERVVTSEPELPGTVVRLPMVHGPGDPYRRLSTGGRRSSSTRRRPAGSAHEATSKTWRRRSPWRPWTIGGRAEHSTSPSRSRSRRPHGSAVSARSWAGGGGSSRRRAAESRWRIG